MCSLTHITLSLSLSLSLSTYQWQIEDFWSTFNNIQPPSLLAKNANYHFFKKGIYPLWEDEANQEGGKWILTIRDDPRFLDQVWQEVVSVCVCVGVCVLIA